MKTEEEKKHVHCSIDVSSDGGVNDGMLFSLESL
jgi:hypothetical protein